MQQFYQLKEKYIKEYNEGKYEDALKTIKKLNKVKPNDLEVYMNIAKLYEEGFRDIKKAILYRKKAFILDNKNFININKLGALYNRQGDKKKAENMWKQGMKLKDYICTINLGDLKFNLNKYEEALDIFENAVNLRRDNIYAYYMLARLKGEHLGQSKEAIKILKKIIDRKVTDKNKKYMISAYIGLAILYEILGNVKVAIEVYKKALKIQEDKYIYQNLGAIHVKYLGDFENAKQYYRKAIEKDKNFITAMYNYADVIYKNFTAKEYIEAIRVYERLLEIGEKDIMIPMRLYALYEGYTKDVDKAKYYYDEIMKFIDNDPYKMGRFASEVWHSHNGKLAEKIYKRILEKNYKISQTHNDLGIIYKTRGENDLAKEYYTRAISLNPNIPEPYFELALLLRNEKKSANAIQIYKKVLEYNINNKTAIINLAFTYDIDLNINKEAKEWYKKALDIEKMNANLFNNYAIFCKKLKNFAKAERYYEKAFNINPFNEIIANNLITIYEERNKYKEAIKICEYLIEQKPNNENMKYKMTVLKQKSK
ncbi:MAG TPA: hypothetical protein DCP90_02765 [Clostridiales bacterium]|nr:MAG: hypothetical protein A2Y22_00010 [Clostridiales bacterium GWD2_32_59]HAN09515.1 hypothetical protein [Clostridiales bacterium]